MFDLQYSLIEAEARHRIAERVARAASPHASSPRVTERPRTRLARRLRSLADRVDY